jgi:predicted GNAT family acetyltransferase
MTDTLPDVRHNVAARRFETTVDDLLARADYQVAGGVMRLYHTEVPQALEGRGIAGAMVKAALAHARAEGLRVEPACSYVRAYMKRHPDTQDLLAEG